MTEDAQLPLLLTADQMAQLLDVPRMRLLEAVQRELVPLPVEILGRPYWRSEDVLAWTRSLGATTPQDAADLLWTGWQEKTLAELNSVPGAEEFT